MLCGGGYKLNGYFRVQHSIMRLGFIGVGKISSSLVEAFCTASIAQLEIFISPRNEVNADKLTSEFGVVQKMKSNQEVLDHSDIIFLGLRPNDAIEVIKQLRFKANHIVVSMNPFLQKNALSELTVPAQRVCLAIPLPSVINHICPIPIYNGDELLIDLFGKIGQPLVIETEDELHKIWALTGFITPFYEMMDTLSQWAVDKGVHEKTANRYIVDMFQSLATVAQVSDNIDLKALAIHAATAKGMNDQAGRDIRSKGAHEAYFAAADTIYKRIEKQLLETTPLT